MFNFQDTLAAKAVEEQQLGYDTDIKDSTPLLDRRDPSAGPEFSNRCMHLRPVYAANKPYHPMLATLCNRVSQTPESIVNACHESTTWHAIKCCQLDCTLLHVLVGKPCYSPVQYAHVQQARIKRILGIRLASQYVWQPLEQRTWSAALQAVWKKS